MSQCHGADEARGGAGSGETRCGAFPTGPATLRSVHLQHSGTRSKEWRKPVALNRIESTS
jgi:hypothetical protein